MKQLIYIGGGDCFRSENDLCEALKEWTYVPFQDKKRRRDQLETELKDQFEIETPNMPNIYNARYKERKIWFEKILPYLNDEKLVLVGHSLWCLFLAKYLSENKFPKKIQQLHLIAAIFDGEDLPEDENYLADFTFDPAWLVNLEKQVDKIFLYHSKDDPMVPFVHAEKFQSHLPKAKLMVFADRGHFNLPEFPELLENIRRV